MKGRCPEPSRHVVVDEPDGAGTCGYNGHLELLRVGCIEHIELFCKLLRQNIRIFR